jgi:hypothetical protein
LIDNQACEESKSGKETEMKKVFIVVALVAVLTLAMAAGAMAEQTAPDGSVGGQKDPAVAIEKAEQRITKLIEKAEKMKEAALEKAKKGDERLGKIIDRLEEQGKEVSKLAEYRKVLASRIATAAGDCDALIAKLKEARDLASQDTIEQFKASLKAARELQARVKADLREIKQYTRTVIRPAIQALLGTDGRTGRPSDQLI